MSTSRDFIFAAILVSVAVVVMNTGCGRREIVADAKPDVIAPDIFPGPLELYSAAAPVPQAFDPARIMLEAHRKRGDVFYSGGDYRRAIPEYEGALSSGIMHGPETLDILRNLACAYAFEGDKANHHRKLKEYFQTLAEKLTILSDNPPE